MTSKELYSQLYYELVAINRVLDELEVPKTDIDDKRLTTLERVKILKQKHTKAVLRNISLTEELAKEYLK